jgi:hypothetical protein
MKEGPRVARQVAKYRCLPTDQDLASVMLVCVCVCVCNFIVRSWADFYSFVYIYIYIFVCFLNFLFYTITKLEIVTIRLSLNFILGVKIYTLDREYNVS